MYCLILLYYTMRVELRPMQPMLKFVAIKFVVFLTFWQSVLLALLVWTKVLTPDESWAWKTQKDLSNGLQCFVIIVEMFAMSILHHAAFPVDPFVAGGFNQFGTSWTQQVRSLWDHSDGFSTFSRTFYVFRLTFPIFSILVFRKKFLQKKNEEERESEKKNSKKAT